MVYLIRPPNIAGNLDELLVLWTFIFEIFRLLFHTWICLHILPCLCPYAIMGTMLSPQDLLVFLPYSQMPEGTFLTKKWQLRLSYKLWQCYCFLNLLPLSVWQKNLLSLGASYLNSWATSLFSRGSASVVEIFSVCGRQATSLMWRKSSPDGNCLGPAVSHVWILQEVSGWIFKKLRGNMHWLLYS